jgi:hypothetical protein
MDERHVLSVRAVRGDKIVKILKMVRAVAL